jgi:menaquinone-dependent protoporphyrinogen oxidase
MKAIIIYDSVHGSTEKCAIILSTKINAETEIKRLQNNEDIRIDEYDIVIIGGSIHHGVIQSRIEKFMQKNQSQLMEKKTGLYLCCMEEGEIARQQFAKAYPSDLRKNAVAAGLFGGEFNLGKMSLFERNLTRKLTGIMSSVSKINENEIRKFAEKINQVIGE